MATRTGGRTMGALVPVAACLLAGAAAAQDGPKVTVAAREGALRVEVDGALFTEVLYTGHAKPMLYPVVGPKGIGMTRNFPMREVQGEARDHPHHKSLWYTHGAVNGVDFWAEGKGRGTIVQDRILSIEAQGNRAVVATANTWLDGDGKPVLTDTRVLAFTAAGGMRMIDHDITLHASEGALVFGDTKEGTMGIRTHPNLRLSNSERHGVTTANGRGVNSRGVRDQGLWGTRAEWVDYWGVVDGTTVGVAIFDHPRNPRHPTWWHARDYGLVAANAFGVHDFERKPAGTGDLRIPAGESRTFRFRFVFHEGDWEQAGIEHLYARYAGAAGPIPEGYALVYSQSFTDAAAINDFEFTDAAKWTLGARDGNACMECLGVGAYKPKVRSPHIIALLRDRIFEDFVLEVDMLQTGREYGHRDMCVFFGFTDPSRFYYVHLATKADPNAHNVFIVNDAPRRNFASKTTQGVDWGSNVWRRVRVERTVADGRIRVFFEDMTTPVMEAADTTFGRGYIGLGSFDDEGMIDNLRIWAPAMQEKPSAFFTRKK